MSTEATVNGNAKSPKAAKSPAKAKAPAKPKSDKPTYLNMIINGIRALKENHGSSRQALLKYVVSTYELDAKVAAVKVKAAIKSGMAKGQLKYGKSKIFLDKF